MATTRDEVVIELVAQTQKALGGIKKMALAVGAVVAGVKSFEVVSRKVFESVRLAGELNAQSIAFTQLAKTAGVSSLEVLSAMQEMTKGTITRLDLMRTASQASLLGIGFTEMPKLLEIARAAAIATGQDMAFMFDSIVTGVGRASPLILDNLGIVLKVGEANAVYAEELGKTVEELSGVERKQAVLNATLLAGEKIISDVGTAVDNMTDPEVIDAFKVSMTELATEIGQLFAPAMRKNLELFTRAATTVTTELNLRRGMVAVEEDLLNIRGKELQGLVTTERLLESVLILNKFIAQQEAEKQKFLESATIDGKATNVFGFDQETVDNLIKSYDDVINARSDDLVLLQRVIKTQQVAEAAQKAENVTLEANTELLKDSNNWMKLHLDLLHGITYANHGLAFDLREKFFTPPKMDEPENFNEQYWQDFEDRYKWAEKAEHDFQMAKLILSQEVHDEALRQAEELKEKLQETIEFVSTAGVSAFRQMGIAIGNNTDLTEAFTKAILRTLSSAAELLAIELAVNGAKAIGMGNVVTGLAMIGAAAAIGLAGGILNGITGTGSDENGNGYTPTNLRRHQETKAPSNVIIVNNTSVSGSYLASRNTGVL